MNKNMKMRLWLVRKLLNYGTSLPLEAIALTGDFHPLAFITAARHVPEYKSADAHHLENQYFNSNGFPITDKEYTETINV